MTTAIDPTLLTVRGLSKSFPGQRALSDLDLDVRSGEIVAVVGSNGSGKSTLVKLLTGVHEPDPGGSMTVCRGDGQQVTGHAARAEIHAIHQDLGLIPMLTTIENLGLGRTGRRSLAPTKGKQEGHHARQLIRRFGADFDVRARVEKLTPAERTIVAMARALDSWENPRQLLLLDEPTASLHGSEADRLFTAVRRVAQDGAGVVFISHRLDEVLGLADRVVALRGGRVVADMSSADLDRPRLIHLIAGRVLPERVATSGHRRAETVLSLTGVRGPGIDRISLGVHAGEIVGICGILGSGRERLAGLIFGVQPRSSGEVLVGGKALRSGSPRDAVAAGVGLVPADRHADGAVMGMRARENLTLPGLRPLRSRLGSLGARAERRTAREWVRRVELDPAEPERALELFSGGNQQKIVLAKWLRNRPKVLLLDEPTQGVDVGAKAAIYRLITDAASNGAGVLISSSDTAELSELCDRVLILRDGLVVTELERRDLSESRLVVESLSTSPSTAPQQGPRPTEKDPGHAV